jgi:zinc transporter 1
MISACAVKWTDWKYKNYIDPFISLLILVILVWGSTKLFIKTSKTVLESTPSDVDVSQLREDLMKIEGMVAVHELHVWQLSNKNYISTCHVVVDSKERNQQVYADSTNVFMQHQIFSSTIQIEFVDDFPAGVNHVGSCFYASTLCNNKRCFVTPPVYQHQIGCPHINLIDIEGTDDHDHHDEHDDYEHNHHEHNHHKQKKKEKTSDVKDLEPSNHP